MHKLATWVRSLWKQGTIVVRLKSGKTICCLRPTGESAVDHAKIWREWLDHHTYVRLDYGRHGSAMVRTSEIAAVEIW